MDTKLDERFDEKECLLRAVYPENKKPTFWKNGRLYSAALKDSRGLSVNRTDSLPMQTAVAIMRPCFTEGWKKNSVNSENNDMIIKQ